MKSLVIASCALMLAVPAAAQTNQQQDPAQQTDKCRAQTDPGAKQQAGNGNLTEKLDDCGGVLKPPATGDQGMAAPAPDEGKTPVIKPGEVPAQPPAK
ncbi:hypothetical protein LB577_01710 [Mesorhizobium sp. B283B1A]|uniref:Uncharacterized protein n=1 Tax=Mesorhizobium opportunistum TaxID=593909 RepID=A0ABV1YKX6_9HYPH|nr:MULTISPECIES: hypothetical protein [Mesorhizobium]ESY63816.1 hypothetical protein X742_27715 [Mesorhizobium sp. LNHC232B00]MCA0045680.1 hypothetical protein [Mesorhizobium sp. B283B1A]TIN91518.1 MAG: hypothetical protein E5Y06_27315 [Mesorhizobium sp.]TJU94401.1 MAG: hypothetical protein E5Y08_30290 [Mesorhizobium sp.]TJV04539.1 MAG: hypothetical protein E5Y12_12340 [Mesorhizobium sp.]